MSSCPQVKELLSTIERRFWSLGALRSPWAHLRDHVLAQVGDADEASVGQYLALFQHYVVHDDILSPSAYLDVIRSSGARSTFLPPSRGDVVALMRSGLAAHLRSLKTKLPSAEALLEDARNGPRMERATVIAIRRCIEEPQQEPGER